MFCFDQVDLVGHDLREVLVGLRDLVEKSAGSVPVPGATFHLPTELLDSEPLLGLTATVATSRAVGARLVAGGVPEPVHDVNIVAHRARYHSTVLPARPDRALPRDPQLYAV